MYELLFFISFPLKKEEWKLVESKHLQNMIKNIIKIRASIAITHDCNRGLTGAC